VRSPPAFSQPDITMYTTFLRALALCTNLESLNFQSASLVPHGLKRLVDKPRLTSLKMYAGLTYPEAQDLLKIKNLRQLCLESPSRAVLHVLPTWIGELKETLVSLSIKVYSQ
jgi:hypothetical protein